MSQIEEIEETIRSKNKARERGKELEEGGAGAEKGGGGKGGKRAAEDSEENDDYYDRWVARPCVCSAVLSVCDVCLRVMSSCSFPNAHRRCGFAAVLDQCPPLKGVFRVTAHVFRRKAGKPHPPRPPVHPPSCPTEP